MAEKTVLNALSADLADQVVGVFGGPWDTGRSAKDGAVLGFENVFNAFATAEAAGELKLLIADIGIFRDYRRIREFLCGCDVVYANCGPWAALLYLVREREQLHVRIIREVRTVGWVGYIWQEEVVSRFARRGDQRVFPSRYARDIWDAAAPDVSHSRIYYPIVRRTAFRSPHVARSSGTVGFFSVLSMDKGFGYLPSVIARMLAAGRRIDRLVVAGERADPALYVRVVDALLELGIEVSFLGGLPNADVRQWMAACDCIFFLSVSSIESLGRVIIEASEQSVPVVTADFGAARDLVSARYRIPVKYLPLASGQCDRPFPVAQLDLLHWEPPADFSSDTCFQSTVEQYLVHAQSAKDILSPPLTQLPAQSRPVSFSFHCPVDALQLANCLLDEPAALQTPPLHELLDLGGTLKQFLLSRGYNPRVSFVPECETQTMLESTRTAVTN